MKILFLDDDEARHEMFGELIHGRHEIKKVYTADECIKQLKIGKWDMLFLDHDLGGKVFVESGTGTGYEVACYLEEFPKEQVDRTYIHSFNPTGAHKMGQAIPKAIIKPINIVYSEIEEILRGEK